MTDAKRESWKRLGEKAERRIEDLLLLLLWVDRDVAGAAAEDTRDAGRREVDFTIAFFSVVI